MTIELAGLVVFGRHGYLEEERRLGQRFLVDLWADLDEDATASDRLEDTVDYRRLAEVVQDVFGGPVAPAPRRARRRGRRRRHGALRLRATGAGAGAQARRRPHAARRARRGDRRAGSALTIRAYVGLGANLGDRETTLRSAIELLDAEPEVSVVAVSAFRETEPVGVAEQPSFLNGAVAVDTTLIAARAARRTAGRRAAARPRPRRNPLGAEDHRSRPAALRRRDGRRAGTSGASPASRRAPLRAGAPRGARSRCSRPRRGQGVGCCSQR